MVSDMWRPWPNCNNLDAMNVKNYILDPTTESSFQVVLTLMAPLYSVLRLTNMEGSTIGLLYEFMRRRKDFFAKGVEKNREKYQDTPGSSLIYQNAPGSSKITNLPLYPKKYTL